MSVNLTMAAVQEFDAEVKHAYQGMGKLRNTVTVRNGVVGSSYQFASSGAGSASMRGASSSDVTPMGIQYARQTVQLSDWIAPEYTDIFDQAEVNFDEKMELAMTIAKAISRREDQLIIDAMGGGTYNAAGSGTAGFSITEASMNFNMSFLRRARAIMQRQEIDPMNQHIALRAEAMQSLLEDDEVASHDYNTVKALVMGDIDTFMGFKFHVIGDRTAGTTSGGEGGLPSTGSGAAAQAAARHAYAYAYDAIGLAIGIDMKTTVDYVPQKLSWLCVGMLKAGAILRDPKGVIRMVYNSTS